MELLIWQTLTISVQEQVKLKTGNKGRIHLPTHSLELDRTQLSKAYNIYICKKIKLCSLLKYTDNYGTTTENYVAIFPPDF